MRLSLWSPKFLYPLHSSYTSAHPMTSNFRQTTTRFRTTLNQSTRILRRMLWVEGTGSAVATTCLKPAICLPLELGPSWTSTLLWLPASLPPNSLVGWRMARHRPGALGTVITRCQWMLTPPQLSLLLPGTWLMNTRLHLMPPYKQCYCKNCYTWM